MTSGRGIDDDGGDYTATEMQAMCACYETLYADIVC